MRINETFVRREDYVGKQVMYKGKTETIEDISVIANAPPPNTLFFRLNGILVCARDCEWADEVGSVSPN